MTQYDFSPEFEKSVLRLLAHDESFLLQFRGALQAEWFTDAEHRIVAGAILAVFDVGACQPSLGSILEAIPDLMEAGVAKDEVEFLARKTYEAGLPQDAEYVRKQVIDFGANQRVTAILLKSEDYLGTGRIHQFVDDLRDAAYVQSAAATPVYDYLETFMDRMHGNRNRAENVTATGLTAIDGHLEGGGLGGGEMGVLCGLPGWGKSESMVNFGAAAIRKGKRVFHALIGDSPAHRVALRYDCNFSGQTLIECRQDPAGTYNKVRAVMEETGGIGRLKVQWWPAKRVGVRDIEDYLRWLYIRHAWRPDLVILDSPANMKSSGDYRDQVRLAQGEIYKDVNALAGILKVPIWTTIQANRKDGVEQKDEEVLTMAHFAEAFEPARDATLILTINSTKKERNQGLARFHCAKYRDSEAFWTEEVHCDFSRHTFTDGGFDPQKQIAGHTEPAPAGTRPCDATAIPSPVAVPPVTDATVPPPPQNKLRIP